jgi:hypothetical protein
MRPKYLVGIKFDLKEWVDHLQEKHSDWTRLQCKRPFFWQQFARKILRSISSQVIDFIPGLIASYSPEANGVHVFETYHRLGIRLNKDPKEFVWEIAILGEPILD